jgi:hypothetical protein
VFALPSSAAKPEFCGPLAKARLEVVFSPSGATVRAWEDTMPNYERFELRRQSDDLVYVFVLTPNPAGFLAYQRQDQDYWIIYREELGWLA